MRSADGANLISNRNCFSATHPLASESPNIEQPWSVNQHSACACSSPSNKRLHLRAHNPNPDKLRPAKNNDKQYKMQPPLGHRPATHCNPQHPTWPPSTFLYFPIVASNLHPAQPRSTPACSIPAHQASRATNPLQPMPRRHRLLLHFITPHHYTIPGTLNNLSSHTHPIQPPSPDPHTSPPHQRKLIVPPKKKTFGPQMPPTTTEQFLNYKSKNHSRPRPRPHPTTTFKLIEAAPAMQSRSSRCPP